MHIIPNLRPTPFQGNMELPLHLLPLSLLCLLVLVLEHHTSTAVLLLSDVQGKPRDAGEDQVDLGRPRKRILHPSSGLCVLRKHLNDPLKLGPCAKSDAWNYTPQKFLQIQGTYFCLQAVGQGKPVKLSIICKPSDSSWQVVVSSSSSNPKKTHLATKLTDGTTVCLDVDSDNNIVSNPCKDVHCAQASDFDPQWFAIVSNQRGSVQIE